VAVELEEAPQRGEIRQALGRGLQLVPGIQEVNCEGDRVAGLLEHAVMVAN
jgi:hypothetical protein